MDMMNQDVKVSSYIGKLKRRVTSLSIEPVVVLYLFSSLMNHLTNQNLNLEKACRVDLRYNISVCDAMVRRDSTGFGKSQEVEVQKLVSRMGAIRSIFTGSIPVILMLFVGSWSDRHMKRKPVILIPIFCDIIGCFFLLLCSYFFMELPVIYSTLADAIPFAIGGAWCCFFLGTFSYVSDNSMVNQRTIRIGTVSVLQGISMTSGTATAGVLIKPFGYIWIYVITSAMMTSALLYGYKRLQNPEATMDNEQRIKINFMKDFFDIQHIKNTLNVCFRKGPSMRKTEILLLMCLTSVMFGAATGEHSLTYLYTRLKFGWDEKIFSGYNTFHFLIQVIGSSFALTIFSKYFAMPDALLGILAVVCKIISCIVSAAAMSGRVFFSGALIEIFCGTANIALRSIMSKIVPSNELGKSNSLFGLCEALVPMIFIPFYSIVYNSTVNSLLGSHYLVTAAILFVPLGIFYWLHKIEKADQIIEMKSTDDANPENLFRSEEES